MERKFKEKNKGNTADKLGSGVSVQGGSFSTGNSSGKVDSPPSPGRS